jgi:hypothetical protein
MKLYIFLFLQLYYLNLYSQAGDSFSLFVGKRRFVQKSLINDFQKLDFLENLTKHEYLQSGQFYIGLDFRKQIKKNSISLIASSHDDIYFINFELKYGYMLHKNYGIMVGINQFNIPKIKKPPFNFANEYQTFKTENFNQPYGEQVFIKNRSFFLSPFYRINNKWVSVESSLNIGLGGLTKNRIEYNGSNISTFEVIKVAYRATPSVFGFVQPNLRLAFFPVQFKKSQLGIQINATYLPTQRSYNYKRRIDIWTDDNPIFETVKAPKHHINRTEFDLGLIWKN